MSKKRDGSCKERILICKQCGIEFVSDRPRSKYCSSMCRNLWWNLRQKRKNIEDICVICGSKFIKSCRSKQTCSKNCSTELRRKNKNIYDKKMKKENASFKIVTLLRSRLHCVVNRKYKSSRTLVGCTIEELKKHLQETALSNEYVEFNIENYNGSEYHIDHIIPCANFDLLKLEQQEKCFHYTNLQILKAKENLKKHSKII